MNPKIASLCSGLIMSCVPSLDSRKDSKVMHIRGPATATARLVSQMGQEQCSTIFTSMYIDHNNRISALESNKILSII